MGSDRFYPEESPVHRVEVDEFWMDDHPVTVAEFRRFVKATGHVTDAERAPNAGRLSRCRPRPAGAWVARVRESGGPVPLDDWTRLVGTGCRARIGVTRKGPGSNLNGRDRHPVVHVTHADAEAYRRMGGQGAARRRPSGSTRPAAGSTARPIRGATTRLRTASRWRTRGRASSRGRTAARRVRADVAGEAVPAEWLRALRHGRQRVGVDGGLVHAGAHEYAAKACCVPRNPRVSEPTAASYGGGPDARHPAPRDQGWLAPMRAELLPPLSARGAPGRDDRHLHLSHRVSLRDSSLEGEADLTSAR